MSNFSFSQSVFKRLALHTCKNPGLVWERVNFNENCETKRKENFGGENLMVTCLCWIDSPIESEQFVKISSVVEEISENISFSSPRQQRRHKGYLFFSVKDQNLFHRVDTIGNIFTSVTAMSENITDGVTR